MKKCATLCIGLFALSACERHPLPLSLEENVLSQVRSATGELLIPDSYPSFEVDLPPASAAPLDDQELVARVAAGNGIVSIGIRPPGALRSDSTGRVAALGGQQMRVAIESIDELGAEIWRVGKTVPMLLARIEPTMAPKLASLPFVDYVSPSQPLRFEGMVSRVRDGLPRFNGSAEVTPWGIDKVGAPQVWNLANGHNATVAVLDNGLDYDHYVPVPSTVRRT